MQTELKLILATVVAAAAAVVTAAWYEQMVAMAVLMAFAMAMA